MSDSFDSLTDTYGSSITEVVMSIMSSLEWLLTVTLCLVLKDTGQTDGQMVDTTHGKVEGFLQNVLGTQVETYLGIPFAMPPVGNLRFQRPFDAKPWNDTLEVKTPHHSCWTYIDTSFDQRPGVDMWNPNTNMSEDCLYLNIWVPRGASKQSNTPMATMLWIFGGGFFSGTPTLDIYDGKFLAAHSDLIVVSINYRTGPLGFLYMGTKEVPGNMGLLDQQMALRWVFRNIEEFGGDKSRITLFGESAGAASAALHQYSPGSIDYFNQVILLSSAPNSYWTQIPNNVAEARSREFAKFFKCPGMDKAATLQCFMERTPAELSDNQFAAPSSGFLGVPFPPVSDGEFLLEDTHSLTRKGSYKKVNSIMGVVHDEGTYWLLYGLPDYFPLDSNGNLTRENFVQAVESVLPLQNHQVRQAAIALYSDITAPQYRDSYEDILDDIMGDTTFKCPVVNYGHVLSKDNDVYMYSFNQRMESLPWPEWMGVPHGYEIEVVFGQPLDLSKNYTDAERVFSRRVMDYFSNFAKTGNPNGGNLVPWPVYNQSSQSYVILDIGTVDYIQSGLRSLQCHFWSTVAPLIKDPVNNPPSPPPQPCINMASSLQPVFNMLVCTAAVMWAYMLS